MAREDFFDMVYQVVRMIPEGRVSTYGAIAAYLGSKSSSRVVGYAMNGSHKVKPQVPAHRVVNRNGLLTGKMHFETPYRMEELLKKEGVKIIGDQIQNFDKHYWDPAEELKDFFSCPNWPLNALSKLMLGILKPMVDEYFTI